MKPFVKYLMITVLITLVIFWIWQIYRTYLNKQDEKTFLTIYGNVEIRQVDLGFRVEGKITRLFKDEGDYVKKGTLLAVLDDIKYNAQYQKSKSDINSQKASAENAKSIYLRNLPLCQDGTVSKQECDNYKNRMISSQANYQSALKESIIAKDNYDNTKIYAPNSGIITTRIKEEGAIVNATTPVYTLSLTNPIWIRTYVNEKNLANITYGMKAEVITDTVNPNTGKKRIYDGWIGYISPVAEFTPKTVQTTDLRTDLVYRIRVYVFDDDGFLRQGMPVTIKINIKNPVIDKNLKIKQDE